MTQTTNYHLNLWDPSDRILREDFNGDNAKLDAALAEHTQQLAGRLCRAQIIQDYVTTEITKEIIVDTSALQWGEWEWVALLFDQGFSLSQDTEIIRVALGDPVVSTYCSASHSNYFAESRPNPFLVGFLPRHDAARAIQGFYLGSHCGVGAGEGTFSQINCIRLLYQHPSYSLSPGIHIQLWGGK